MTRTTLGRADTVVVVGAGLAGLSAAMHLQGAGRQVTVLERAETPGGLAARVELSASRGGTYRLDTGPTVLTMPDVLGDCFAAVGQDLSSWLELRRLDPAYVAHFADGTSLAATTDLKEMTQRIGELAGPAEAAGYRRYVQHVTELYRLQMPTFIDANIDAPHSLAGPPLARLAARRGFARLAPTVARYVRDPRLQRLLSFQALYAGVSPHRALAIYGVITYMDLVEGVFYPVGGMNAVPSAMAAAASAAGVQIVYGADVTGLHHGGATATEVRTGDDRSWRAEAVVLTCDIAAAGRLLGRELTRAPVRYSPSCVVLAAGLHQAMTGPAHTTAHHHIHFGRSWRRVFDDLDSGRLMRDPSVLVSLPTLTDHTLAPQGAGTAYVLFPAPNLAHERPLDWARLREPYRDHMLRTMERLGYPGFGDAIDAEVLLTPQDWAERGMSAGTPFAAAHTFGQTGPFRTPNLVADNVVLAGAGTTPGVGVPMVLVSGRLAAERITGRDPAFRSLAWR